MATVTETQPTVQWNEAQGTRLHLTHIETGRLRLRPIREEDRPVYLTEIFSKTTMQYYAGSCSDARFTGWLERWKQHNFSALAICLKDEQLKVIGHAILGHGDYAKKPNHEYGFSEVAVIFHQDYWNQGYGNEVGKAILAYAKSIVEQGIPVPVDINSDEDLQEIQELKLPIYSENGKPRAALVPLREIRATCSHPQKNVASLKILNHIYESNKERATKTADENGKFTFRLQLVY